VATLCCSPLETPTAAGNPNPDQRVRVRARGEGYPNPNPSALALIVRWQVARHYGIPAASWLDLMTQAGGFQGPAKSALLFDRRTHPSAAGHALAATLLQRCAYNDATELAHADMTTLPKKDTNCTALSLMPAIIGILVVTRSQLLYARTSVRSEKKARPRLTLGIRLILTFFDSAQCLMVRRWR
jgi:hypothetical protein